ncbi:uncharacterized protein LOC111025282 [Momordica charantia]|uniref:Uncharacterized protein LOC111025282 n=1 Tax=Momordica charantia TaxID=3673 RepID=A0A6J1E232_MOMCH|nr:uncharacterized protein LOC111025282 [Momordica charantia]
MDKKKEESESDEKKLYITSENGESSSFSIISGAEQLDHFSQTGTLPQGRETIEVVLKLPALRLSSLLAAMELEEDTKISIPAPFSNLPKILTGRSLIPLPPNNGEQDQNSSSNERTITSGPSSSSSPSELPHISNAAPALFLRIGSWQVVPQNEGDLVLRFDYRTKKISWEIVREGPSKHKIEIDWSNIIGIEAATEDHRQGILQLELQKPPRFYKEIEAKLQKQSKWIDESDFTDGRASLNRRYFSVFSPGVLGAHYKRMMKNKHVLEVSQKSFPATYSPYFPKD